VGFFQEEAVKLFEKYSALTEPKEVFCNSKINKELI